MKIKTKDLEGAALDWAVAKCEGYTDLRRNEHRFDNSWIMTPPRAAYGPVLLDDYDYSTSWKDGGPIIEREKITLIRCDDDYKKDAKGFCSNVRIPVWAAEHGGGHSLQTQYEGENYPPQYEVTKSDCVYGATPLIAAMRCYVASKLGDEVEIPEELA